MQKLVWGLLLALCGGHRTAATPQPQSNEHKVPYIQNIVLYPDKHSWCKTTEIKQIVAYPGCDSVEIDNSVCVGACFSYSIPKTSPSAPGEVITPYCDSCQPSVFTWKEVKLTCQDDSNEDEDSVVELIKKVQVITNCSCSSCQDQKEAHLLEQQKQAVLNDADVPDLMSLMLHHEKVPDEEIEQDGKIDESAPEPDTRAPPQDLENIIDVDEVKEKEVVKEVVEEQNLEVIHVNQDSKETHLVPGPHHSLVIKPLHAPDHHQHGNEDVRLHKHEDDEQVPSLLENQFKIHNDDEFPDQLAVESRKEYDGKPAEVFTVPDLIYKSHLQPQSSVQRGEETTREELEKQEPSERRSDDHHQQGHHHEKEHKKEVEHSHHNRHTDLQETEHKGVKIVEVSDHHLKPAIEGAQLSYVVKNEANIHE